MSRVSKLFSVLLILYCVYYFPIQCQKSLRFEHNTRVLQSTSQNCAAQCALCSTSNSNTCTACHFPNFLYQGNCIPASQCPVGTFPDTLTLSCQNCAEGCSECLDIYECRKCNPGFNNIGGNCHTFPCPEPTQPDSNKVCIANCEAPRFYRVGFGCATNGPVPFYKNTATGFWEQCANSCGTCSEAGYNHCTFCAVGLLYQGSCIPYCPPGTAKSQNTCVSQCPEGQAPNTYTSREGVPTRVCQKTCQNLADCSNHGNCANNFCTCNPGFTGDNCSTQACAQNCNFRGDCIGGLCQCFQGYTGTTCEGIDYANPPAGLCPDNCSGFGQCTANGCICSPGFLGNNCATRTP